MILRRAFTCLLFVEYVENLFSTQDDATMAQGRCSREQSLFNGVEPNGCELLEQSLLAICKGQLLVYLHIISINVLLHIFLTWI